MSLQITLRPIAPPGGTPQPQPIPPVPRAPDPDAVIAAYGIRVKEGVVTIASKDRTKFLVITPVLILFVDNSARSVKILQQADVPTYVQQLLSTYGITVG